MCPKATSAIEKARQSVGIRGKKKRIFSPRLSISKPKKKKKSKAGFVKLETENGNRASF